MSFEAFGCLGCTNLSAPLGWTLPPQHGQHEAAHHSRVMQSKPVAEGASRRSAGRGRHTARVWRTSSGMGLFRLVAASRRGLTTNRRPGHPGGALGLTTDLRCRATFTQTPIAGRGVAPAPVAVPTTTATSGLRRQGHRRSACAAAMAVGRTRRTQPGSLRAHTLGLSASDPPRGSGGYHWALSHGLA